MICHRGSDHTWQETYGVNLALKGLILNRLTKHKVKGLCGSVEAIPSRNGAVARHGRDLDQSKIIAAQMMFYGMLCEDSDRPMVHSKHIAQLLRLLIQDPTCFHVSNTIDKYSKIGKFASQFGVVSIFCKIKLDCFTADTLGFNFRLDLVKLWLGPCTDGHIELRLSELKSKLAAYAVATTRDDGPLARPKLILEPLSIANAFLLGTVESVVIIKAIL